MGDYVTGMNTQPHRSTGLWVLVAAWLLGPVGVDLAAGASGPPIPDEVKDHIRLRVDNGGAGGIVVGLVGEGGTSFFAYGVAAKGGPALDEDSVFEIGSITKAFTALLLADAVLQRQTQLDDPVAKHVPADFKIPSKGDKSITLAHLATHRSGLPRLPSNLLPNDVTNPYADYTSERLRAFLAGYTLENDPGAAYAYSNLGVGLLGYVLALKAGQSYDDLVRSRLCAPLGMTHTACKLTADMQQHLARGHAAGKPVSNWDLDALTGAGALRFTARDMTRLLAACLGLSTDRLTPLLAKCLETRYPTGMPGIEIALGWHLDRRHDAEIVWHNGGTGGYHSYCGYRADRKLGVVVLTNCSEDIDDIGQHLLAPKAPLATVRPVITLEPAALDDYVGYYALTPKILIHVTRDGSALQAQLTGQDAFPIFAEAKDKFFFRVVDAQLAFVRDAAGRVSKVVLHQNGIDQTAAKLPPDQAPQPRVEVMVAPEVLKAYVGQYRLGPNVVFDVQLDGEKLMVQLTGQPRFQVFAESEKDFFYKVVDAQLTFVREADGKVASLILHQGGIDQTAQRID
jgi:serine-type D-Ala-D-Ala carboxypeptidase/endopeptidase